MTAAKRDLLAPKKAARKGKRGIFNDALLADGVLFDASDEELMGGSTTPPAPPRASRP